MAVSELANVGAFEGIGYHILNSLMNVLTVERGHVHEKKNLLGLWEWKLLFSSFGFLSQHNFLFHSHDDESSQSIIVFYVFL